MPQPYTRQVFYQFTADHQEWYVTDVGADSANFEEVRKNCQEDDHMSGTIELLAGVWRVDEGSRVQIGDNTAVVAIEAHFNAHGAPSGDPRDRDVLPAAEPVAAAPGSVVAEPPWRKDEETAGYIDPSMDIDDLRIELRSARQLVVALDAQRDGQRKTLDDMRKLTGSTSDAELVEWVRITVKNWGNWEGVTVPDPSDREVLQGPTRTPWEPGTRVWLTTGSPGFTVVVEVIADHHGRQAGEVEAVSWLDGECRITLPWQCWTRVDPTPPSRLAAMRFRKVVATDDDQSLRVVAVDHDRGIVTYAPACLIRECGALAVLPSSFCQDHSGVAPEADPATLQEELESERVALRHARSIASSLQQRLNRSVDNAVRLRDELAKKDPPFIPGICVVGGCNVPSTVAGVCREHSNPM